MSKEHYYKHHVFFCINKRLTGKECCADKNALALRDYAKQKTKELGIHGKDGVRINQAGCLDRCEEGPTVVIYPEGVWYTYVDETDIDEIIDQHLVKGKVVKRLVI